MTIQEIYNQVGQKELMEYYYGESIIDKKPIYRNKLRNDRKGTCSFFWSKSNKYLFHDFSTGEFHDVANYVKEYYNIKDFKDVIKKIISDFNLGTINSKPARNRAYKNNSTGVNQSNSSNYVKKKNFEINVRQFKSIDLLFWNQFNITEETLNKFNVYPVKTAYIEDSESVTGKTMIYQYNEKNAIDSILDTNTNSNQLCYVYVVTGGKSKKIKIYQPYNKQFKWLSNTSTVDIFGLEQLEDYINMTYNRIDSCKVKIKKLNKVQYDRHNEQDNQELQICNEYDKRLFIVSGLKDLMVMYEMGFNAIAPTSETSTIDSEIIEGLKQYFNLIVLYDLDNTGIKSSIKHMIKYDCHLYILPMLNRSENEQTERNTLKTNKYKDIAEYSQELGLMYLYDIIDTDTKQYKYD